MICVPTLNAKPSQSHTTPHHTTPHHTTPHHTTPHRTTPNHTKPHRTAPHKTTLVNCFTSCYDLSSFVFFFFYLFNLVDGPLVNEHRLRLLPSKFWRQKRPLRSTVNILVVALVLDSGSEHMDWHIAARCSTPTTYCIVSTSSGRRQTCFEGHAWSCPHRAH